MSHGPHTPGPWSFKQDHVFAPEAKGDDADHCREIGYGGLLIAESINRRNQPIIAAAPELLAACIAAADEDRGLSCFPQLVRAILKACDGELPEQLRDCRASREIAGVDRDS